MPRTTRQLRPLLPRLSPLRTYASGGNGSPKDSQADRLARIESVLDTIEASLETQFQRIADLQVQLDRVIAAQSKHS